MSIHPQSADFSTIPANCQSIQPSEFPGAEDWIFASPIKLGRRPYSYTGVWRELQRTAEVAKVGHLGTHCVHHAHRSWLDAVRTSVAVQQKMMRHADIRTTMNIYGDVATDEMTTAGVDNARWVITAERMKMDRPHIVPLPRQAVTILRELFSLAVVENKTFVFPGMNKQTENGTLNENTLLLALEEIGYKGIMTGHGSRGLASTILHENGFEEAHIELQLSHAKKNKVAASYDYAKYIPQRAELMQWWADYLDAGLSTEKSKVVAIRKNA